MRIDEVYFGIKAIEIVGADCVERFTLARLIAKSLEGTISATSDYEIDDWNRFNSMLDADTVIVKVHNDLPAHILKKWMNNDQIQINRMMEKPYLRSMPSFIFCTGSANPLNFDAADRRFVARWAYEEIK